MKIAADGEAYRILKAEQKRQVEGLELIPSENYVSKAVLEAVGSVLTNKYSEGYPGHRYYGGNFYIDQAENLAIGRAKKLFKTDYHVNVQPYSGSPANIAVMLAVLELGDKVMGMSLTQGGHLTHGHKVNFSGRYYDFCQYGVDRRTEIIDYSEVEKTALKEKPKMIICGATAYPRIINFKAFSKIAEKVKAILMADISHIAGLIAAGVHPTPFGLADIITTTTHKTLRGPRGAVIFCKDRYAEAIDRAVFPGIQGGPHDHVNLAKAVAFGEALKPEFKEYGKQTVKNSQALAAKLIAGGLRLVSGGTDNHLILVDLGSLGVTGKQAEAWLDEAGITVNKNTIPYDERKPMDPSGIRLGTPAVTSRGMKEKEMKIIGEFILRVLASKGQVTELKIIKKEVTSFAKKFPVPGITK
ncbi:MAG: serine hydroxymethyltransferase [Candidatus Berkelbacteria bacterium]|nr:serine hydroxymethyltransferase [Candidatus Berkelbacteria bacterium]